MPDGGLKFTGEIEVLNTVQVRKEAVEAIVDQVKHMDAFAEDRDEMIERLVSEFASSDADYLTMTQEIADQLKPYDEERAAISAARRTEAKNVLRGMAASSYDQPAGAPEFSRQALSDGGLDISLEEIHDELDLDEAV